MPSSITVFTPTYNRAKTLKRCYDSLLSQTSTNFIWLIVDDGSSDNTKELVSKWQKDNLLKIVYVYKENGGKHTAHNTAVVNCTTPYFLILDSDDVLSRACIEVLTSHLVSVEADDSLCGIIGNRFDIYSKKVIGSYMPRGIKHASGSELYQRYGFKGDTVRLYKTPILKNNLFPIIKSEKFIYENVLFDTIDNSYKMLVIHDELYFCEYREDGYTANADKVKVNNPVGYALSLNSSVKYAVSLRKAINWTILYILWCRHLGIANGYDKFSRKIIYILSYPIAHLLELARRPVFFFRLLTLAKQARETK